MLGALYKIGDPERQDSILKAWELSKLFNKCFTFFRSKWFACIIWWNTKEMELFKHIPFKWLHK